MAGFLTSRGDDHDIYFAVVQSTLCLGLEIKISSRFPISNVNSIKPPERSVSEAEKRPCKCQRAGELFSHFPFL